MLRDYEILFIVRPELDDEQVAASVDTVGTLIQNLGGTHENSNVWGKRRLAYEVAHLREGYYVLTDFKLDPARVPELEATIKISDTVFRHLVVRKPEKVAAKPTPAEEPAAAEPVAAATEPEAVATEPEAAPAEAETTETAAAGEPEVAPAAEQKA